MDYRVACWATENLSPSGLKAWLRLVTFFRNDRPIPKISERRLAQITGLSAGSAHKALMELRQVLVFAGDDPQEPIEATAGEHQGGCSQHEQGAQNVSMGGGAQIMSKNAQIMSRSAQEMSKTAQEMSTILFLFKKKNKNKK
jgi:hypothetical protein